MYGRFDNFVAIDDEVAAFAAEREMAVACVYGIDAICIAVFEDYVETLVAGIAYGVNTEWGNGDRGGCFSIILGGCGYNECRTFRVKLICGFCRNLHCCVGGGQGIERAFNADFLRGGGNRGFIC